VFSKMSRLAVVSPSLLDVGYGGFFRGGKAAVAWSSHLLPSCSEVKNVWNDASASQCLFMWWCFFKQMATLRF